MLKCVSQEFVCDNNANDQDTSTVIYYFHNDVKDIMYKLAMDNKGLSFPFTVIQDEQGNNLTLEKWKASKK